MNSSAWQLQQIDGPLLIFGGPYSNLHATQAMRREAAILGIPAHRTFCTGDVVAYCASPNETIAELTDWGCHVLLGNCEESLGQEADDCGCGFATGSTCSLLSMQWYQYARSRISSVEEAWMRSLPAFIHFSMGQLKVVVVHGAASAINRFIFASTPAEVLLREFALVEADVIIAGHSGIPFSRILTNTMGQKKLWHNAGVIGMPANEGRSDVWYSLIYPQQGGRLPKIEHKTLSYPAELAQQEMYRVGLNNGYAEALTTGLWPSMDVLPDCERAQRGQWLTTLISEQ